MTVRLKDRVCSLPFVGAPGDTYLYYGCELFEGRLLHLHAWLKFDYVCVWLVLEYDLMLADSSFILVSLEYY